ncbi:hypothetical protein ACIBI9_48475 [Nonomuraea sp. NPDC050451]
MAAETIFGIPIRYEGDPSRLPITDPVRSVEILRGVTVEMDRFVAGPRS